MTTPRRLYAAALLIVIAAVNTSPAYITLLLVDVGWSKFRWQPDADFWPVFAVFVGAAAMPAAIAALLIGMKVHTRKWPHRAIITSWLSASTCFSFFRLIYFPWEDPNTGEGSPLLALFNIAFALFLATTLFGGVMFSLRYSIMKGFPKAATRSLPEENPCPQPQPSPPQSTHSTSSQTTPTQAQPSPQSSSTNKIYRR